MLQRSFCIVVAAFAVGASGCKHPSTDSEPTETTPAEQSTSLPPAFETEPLKFAHDPGLYPEPKVVLEIPFDTDRHISSDEYAVFIAADGTWMAIELAAARVAGRGSLETRGLDLKGFAGPVLVYRTGGDLEAMDVRTGESVEEVPEVGQPPKAISKWKDGEQKCGRKSDEGWTVWTIPCRDFMKRQGAVVLSWDLGGSRLHANRWGDGTDAWQLEPVGQGPATWRLVGSSGDVLWLRFANSSVSAFVAVDPESGVVRKAVRGSFDSGGGVPNRYWLDGDAAVRVIDLTQTGPRRRESVPLKKDVAVWFDEMSAGADDRAFLIGGAYDYEPEVVESEVRARGAGAFVALAGVLPSAAVNELAADSISRANAEQLTDLAKALTSQTGVDPALRAAIRVTFEKPPTADWVEARTRLTRLLLGTPGGRFGVEREQKRLPDEFIPELVAATAAWVEDAATTPDYDSGMQVAPGLDDLLLVVFELADVGSPTPGLAEPVVDAVAKRPRTAICPWSASNAPDAGATCDFGEPPGGASISTDGDVAAWFTRTPHLYGELVVMRRVDGTWKGPYFTGHALSDDEYVRGDRIGGLGVEPTGESVVVRDGERAYTVRWPRVTADGDDDGWTDVLEERIGTDPAAADSDGDGTPDPEDPLTGCARKEPATDEQRLFRAVALRLFTARNDVGPLLAEFEPEHCVEVPTIGAPVIRVDEAFLQRSEGRKQRVGFRVTEIRFGKTVDDFGPGLDGLQESTFPRWYTEESAWREAPARVVNVRVWLGGHHGFDWEQWLFADVDGEWRRIAMQ